MKPHDVSITHGLLCLIASELISQSGDHFVAGILAALASVCAIAALFQYGNRNSGES